MSYTPPDPDLSTEYEKVAAMDCDDTPERRHAASALAMRLRSRLMDLATWKADIGPEYELLAERCRLLTSLADKEAPPFLTREFGSEASRAPR